MKKFLTLILILILLPFLKANAQSDLQCSQLSGNIYQLEWHGVPGRSYFIQASTDNMLTWDYLPDIRFGQGHILRLGFEKVVDEMYLRLRFTDATTTNPDLDDFDGDGWTNLEEVMVTLTDPFEFNAGGPGTGNGSGSSNQNVGNNPAPPLAQFELKITEITLSENATFPETHKILRLDAGFNAVSDAFGQPVQSGVPSISVSRSDQTTTLIRLTDLTGTNQGATLNYLQLQSDPNPNNTLPAITSMVNGHTLVIPTQQGTTPPTPFVTIIIPGDLPDGGDSGTFWQLKPMDITTVFGIGPEFDSRAVLTNWLESARNTNLHEDEGLPAESFNIGNIWGYRGLAPLKPNQSTQDEKIYAIEVSDTADSLSRALQSKERTVVFDGHANYGLGPNFERTHVRHISDFINFGSGETAIETGCLATEDNTPIQAQKDIVTNGPNSATLRFYDEGWAYLILEEGANGNPSPEMRGDVVQKIPLATLTPSPNLGLRFQHANVPNGGTITRQGTAPNFFHYPGHLIVDAPNEEVPANLGYKAFFYNACSSGIYFMENFQHGEFVYTTETVAITSATKVFVEHTVSGVKVDLIVSDMVTKNLGGANKHNEYRLYVFPTN